MKQLEIQLSRWMRLIVFAGAASPAAHQLATTWGTRWPVLGAGVGLLELVWRQFVAPTVPKTSTTVSATEQAELTAAINALAELAGGTAIATPATSTTIATSSP